SRDTEERNACRRFLGKPLPPRQTAQYQHQAKAVKDGDGLELLGAFHKLFVPGPTDGDQYQGKDVHQGMFQSQKPRCGIHAPHAQDLNGIEALGGHKIENKAHQQLDVAEYQCKKTDSQVLVQTEVLFAHPAQEGIDNGQQKYGQYDIGQIGMQVQSDFHEI